MNPVEYIRRDSEGSDSDTRRRAAADLVRSLAEQFEGQVAELFTGYVAQLLQVCLGVTTAGWKIACAMKPRLFNTGTLLFCCIQGLHHCLNCITTCGDAVLALVCIVCKREHLFSDFHQRC